MLLSDDFTDGFDLTHTSALLTLGSFVADDGIATTSSAGLRVVGSDTNPVTGKPAFPAGGTSQNEFDHTKWMADTRHVSSNSYPGFDAIPGHVLSCTMWAQGQAFRH